MAEVESRQGDRWAFRGWKYRTHSWCLLSKGNRHPLCACSVPRWRSRGTRFGCRSNRPCHERGQRCAPASSCRQRQRSCCYGQASPVSTTPGSDSGRGGPTWVLLFAVVWTSGAEGNTERRHRINVAVVKALADSSMPARLGEVGQEIFPPNQQTPE